MFQKWDWHYFIHNLTLLLHYQPWLILVLVILCSWSLFSCCHSVTFCTLATQAFWLQHTGAVTRMWRSVRCNLHKMNVQSMQLIVKRKGCCCNLSISVVLNAQFTMNMTCVKNSTHLKVALTCKKIGPGIWTLLLLATIVWKLARMLLRIFNRNHVSHLKRS